MRRPAGPNLPRPRRTERAASARPAEPLCKAAKPPSYLSYSSYWSYRGIREEVHLASNQYGPGKMANFPCSAKTPVRAKPDGPTPVALRANRPLIAPFRPSSSRLVIFSGTSSVAHWHVADVPGVQGQLEAWKFRGLEAWFSRWGSAPHFSVARLSRVLFSVLCSPFSGAALAAPPLPGRGAAPCVCLALPYCNHNKLR